MAKFVIKTGKTHIAKYIYVLFLVAYIIQSSQFYNEYEGTKAIIFGLYIASYLLCVCLVCLNKVSLQSFIWIVGLIAVGILVFINTYSVDLIESLSTLNLFVMIIGARGLDFDKTVKLDVAFRKYSTVILFILSFFGVITNLVTSRSGGIIRYAFGYGHANRFGAAILLIVLYSAYLKRKERSIKEYILELFALFIVYFGANSRSTAVGIAAVILYRLFVDISYRYKENKRLIRMMRGGVIVGLFVIVALFFYSAYHYSESNTIMSYINSLFNSRLVLSSMYGDYYKITPFGNAIRMYTWSDVQTLGKNRALTAIDILYLKIFFRHGYVTLAIYLYILYYNMKYAIKRDGFLFFCILLMSILSCIENQFYTPVSNIFLLIFANKIVSAK